MENVISGLNEDLNIYNGIKKSKIFDTFDKFYPKLKN